MHLPVVGSFMTTRAFFHLIDREVDLVRLSPSLYGLVVSLHGKIKRDSPPVLTCLGNGEPMHVYRHHTGRYFVRHFSNGHQDGHAHPDAISVMSDEHRRQADYTQRAAMAYGLNAELEVSTGNGTRLDVGVIGLNQVGFEIQRSALSLPNARSRASKSFRAGWPTAWITDSVPDPGWADWVPTARLEVRSGWSECRTRSSDTWWVSLREDSEKRVARRIGVSDARRADRSCCGWFKRTS